MPAMSSRSLLRLGRGAVIATAASVPSLDVLAQASAPPPASAASAARLDKVEITGGRATDNEQRRQSTAAKIVIGREEIERFGDSTVGEVLKRLPGVTVQGAPGRGGGIRMRGLGGGYTQMLLDGERVPPGFSLDSLTPEQIERIEVFRAPTAETGARAIAGTINIVTREGFRKRLNDLRFGVGIEEGKVSPGVSWTRNESLGDWTANLSLSAFRQNRGNDSDTVTVRQAPTDPAPTMVRTEHHTSEDRRSGIHLTSRLQWRNERGSSLTLNPFLIHSEGRTLRQTTTDPSSFGPAPDHDRSTLVSDTRFTLMRLNGQFNHRLGEGARLEWKAGLGRANNRGHGPRHEFDVGAATPKRTVDEDSKVTDDSLNASLKWLRQLDNEHSLVAGIEAEGTQRSETRTLLETTPTGTRPLFDDLGDNFRASTARTALYVQDEWNLNPHWSAHAGLRWEGVTTRADTGASDRSRSRSSVWTPLAHAVWKPDPKSRDQVRMSLTRSYKSPTTSNLIARPSVSSRFPVEGPINDATSPDRVGNPDLQPELATGIDVAFERYLKGGGILSASLFHRQIRNLIRNVTAIERPWWADGRERYVSRPQNIGDAITQGIELEAKFRASEIWDGAPPVDLRANTSFFRSRVKSVPGPDNRLDQQPSATANLGVDYRFRGAPMTIGGNYNWNPDYATRLSENQAAYQGAKRVLDAYLLWTLRPSTQLRLSASNLTPSDYVTASTVGSETATTIARSHVNWQIRMEMKL
jgi:outer membrane receptor for ferrienterochelin and colicins